MTSYGRDARSRQAPRTDPADFLGEDFVSRLKAVQKDVKTTPPHKKETPAIYKPVDPPHGDALSKSRRQAPLSAPLSSSTPASPDDMAISELNSLYAVVQEIKNDINHMSTSASKRTPISREPAHTSAYVSASSSLPKTASSAYSNGQQRSSNTSLPMRNVPLHEPSTQAPLLHTYGGDATTKVPSSPGMSSRTSSSTSSAAHRRCSVPLS